VDDIDLGRAASVLKSGRVLVLTGAGISVDSGIPDFRSPGGLWTRFPPEEYATIEAFLDDPRKVWRLFDEVGAVLGAARPNRAHEALARLERAGKLSGIVTQNIDALHQGAGSENVVEYHGSTARLACLKCGARHGKDAPPKWEEPAGPERPRVPLCACGEVLKPDIVMFGEMIPPEAERAVRQMVAEAQACLVCGTSALVHPAAAIPARIAERGGKVIEVNLAPTPLTERVTDLFLQGGTSDVLPKLAERALA
jgi:NAD-dependent deacetylase